jgi:hypothetical protein
MSWQNPLAAKLGPLATSAIVSKMLAAQARERQQLVAEMQTIRGLMPLLMKPRNGDRWTATERAALTQQIRALAHLSPYLVVMVLPGSFVALPMLAWWLDRRRLHRDEPARR